MNLINFSTIFISLVLVFYILSIGKSFFIPIVIAVVIWYLIIAMASFFGKIMLNEKRAIPRWLALSFSLISIFFIFWALISLLEANIQSVVSATPGYQEKFKALAIRSFNAMHIDQSSTLDTVLESINLTSMVGNLANFAATLAKNISMIFIYVLFLLAEYRTFNDKFAKLFKDKGQQKKVSDIVVKIDQDIKTYISIKTIASFVTACLSFVVLVFVGVDFPVFWALIIFLLNFIPTVGSIVAVIFPVLLTLIQFDTLGPFIVVLVLLMSVQVLIGNVLEPKFMGKSLNLSPLVIIISLVLWGNIWGVTGMFLCVPIMVILNIVLSKFSKTRSLAIIFSASGKI